MNNKHQALWAVGALLAIFVALLIWYMWTHPAPQVTYPDSTATTTPLTVVGEPLHIIDNGQYHEIDATYPSATPLYNSAGAEADREAVTLMRTFAQNSVTTFKESANMDMPGMDFAQGRKYTMDIDYKLYESPKTISYVYVIYQDTLGAHPNGYYRTFTFDRTSGEALHLEDLFAPGVPYLERLSERTRADLPLIMARMSGQSPTDIDKEYIDSGTLPISDSFNNFAINGTNLVMIFPPYQVGPYVFGTLEVPIPLSSMSSILNSKYKL